MKKKFTVPFVILTTAMPNDFGGRTGAGGVDSIKPVPCKFEEWMQSRWFGDYDKNGSINENDYALWWAQNGFTTDTWTQYNPSLQWKDEWSK